MPAELKVTDEGIARFKDEKDVSGEVISNFSMEFLARVNVELEAGGPGVLARIKRFPDYVEKDCFIPMTELSGNVAQLSTYLNLVFPSGALFIVCSPAELKRLLLRLTTALLESRKEVAAARYVGRNTVSGMDAVWVFSKVITLSSTGTVLPPNDSPILWLKRPTLTGARGNLLLKESLACNVSLPLDEGDSIIRFCRAIQNFMPENFVATMATMACGLMAASYSLVISTCGCIGVPILFGEPGSCKSEALKCCLALFGSEKTHFFNSQTTISYIFEVLSGTTLPIGLDDINIKAQDTWEELIVDAYNNTVRGTRSYNTEKFQSMPILTANWHFFSDKKRAHTRSIVLPFTEHTDEENSTSLYDELLGCRTVASSSIGKLVTICEGFATEKGQSRRNNTIHPQISAIFSGCEARFRTTFSTFAYFFLELCKLTSGLLTEEQCFDFIASSMLPYAQMNDGPRPIHLPSSGLNFLALLGHKANEVPKQKLLQTVAVDVPTRGSLGTCMAIRVGDALNLIKETGVETTLTRSSVETSLLEGLSSRRSQQKFLHYLSTDTSVRHASRGVGGNTQNQRCIIIKQESISEEVVAALRQAMSIETSFLSCDSSPSPSSSPSVKLSSPSVKRAKVSQTED